jgi:branched-chain amino acid transport system ATP-binding protein
VFPDKLHHPKEEEYLFQALRRRKPDSVALLDELEMQHVEGGRLIAELERALKDYDRNYPDGLEVLRKATQTYVDAQREHIAREEREVLPLARKYLKKEDWGDISRAFARNSDPMFGENIETGFQALFERITR